MGQVQALCPGTDRAARQEAPECGKVLAFLEAPGCSACDEAALLVCACRTGGALHLCLRHAAGLDGVPLTGDEAQTALCEAQAETVVCSDLLGPVGAACGDASAGPQECLSGLCRDADPANNSGEDGDRPDDWRCVDPCANDLDCARGWICDRQIPLADPPAATPFTCRKSP